MRRIAKGVWEPGSRIPTETVLAAEFRCSRATVNRALQNMARKGIVERRRKAGTRVLAHPLREARLAIPVVRAEIESKGLRYRYTLLARVREPPPASVARVMGLAERARVLHVRSLHEGDGQPYQYEERWINPVAVPQVEDASFEKESPNEWLIREAPFTHAEFSFTADAATPDAARWLGLAEGQPLFVAERVTWLQDIPVTFVRMMHPPGHRVSTRV